MKSDLKENPRVRSLRFNLGLANHDVAVALRSLVLLVTLLFVGSACDEGGDSAADASFDVLNATAEAGVDVLRPNVQCDGVAPMGECGVGAGGCCGNDFRMRQLECRNGKWRCPKGYSAFEECCGFGPHCTPAFGISPMCAPQCRQSGDQWYCGQYFPDADAGSPSDSRG
ncbi:MAG: hypothetical protein SF187_17080 [Deltaproteobacteria bacterium]|nr:hypothetical protein [Deltaproteobacteria bacterium]